MAYSNDSSNKHPASSSAIRAKLFEKVSLYLYRQRRHSVQFVEGQMNHQEAITSTQVDVMKTLKTASTYLAGSAVIFYTF